MLNPEDNCSGELDMDNMIKDYEAKCYNKAECEIDFTNYLSSNKAKKAARPKCYDPLT